MDEIAEILARGYHNALNRHWVRNFGSDDRPWDALPEEAALTGIENKRDIRLLMREAIDELEASGYRIVPV